MPNLTPLPADDFINRATEAEFDAIPGIGPVTARNIVEYRTRTGGFQVMESLLGVSGVGPKLLENIRAARLQALATISPAAPPTGYGMIPADCVLNTGGQTELEALPGIGPALARRILTRREQLGGFASHEDLLSVSGIGPATLNRILLHLGLPLYAAPAPAPTPAP